MIHRLGIFGGSFNPVHLGHCIMAELFTEQMKLDKCLFIPTFISPFKPHVGDAAHAQHRLRMLRILCRTNPAFSVDDFEIRRATVSYTIDTIHYLHSRYQPRRLFLLIGSDLVAGFQKWKDWQSILRQSEICIAQRSATNTEYTELISEQLRVDGRSPHILNVPAIEMSSRQIRDRIASAQSVRYMVPEKVRRHIVKHKLYAAP